MKKRFIAMFFIFITILGASPLFAQKLKSMEFRNQNITDILIVLAQATGTSILPDETVKGNASFYFSESDFETALSLFLSTNKLYYTKEGSVYRISRIAATWDTLTGNVKMKAEDVSVESLVKVLSKTIGKTILYDALPAQTISVDIDQLSPVKALEIISKRLNGYKVEAYDSYYYIKQLPQNTQTASTTGTQSIIHKGDEWSLALDKGRFLELIASLFKQAGKEYSILIRSDSSLENLYFSGRDFDSLLRLILEQGNADFVVHDNVYYIVELPRQDILKKLNTTQIVSLTYLPAQDLPNLLPSDLASGNVLRIDKNTNTVILTGSDEETAPILDFIKLVDRPLDGMKYQRFDIKYLKVKEILTVIPAKMTPIPPVIVPDSNSFIILGSNESLSTLGDFIKVVDAKQEGYPVRLKYIKTEDLLKTLPPSITKEDIVDSGYPNLFFFTGSDKKRSLFLSELATVDRPKPQIRYQLLVIQYVRNRNLTTKSSVSATPESDTAKAIIGNLSNIVSLNFDVVSKFGYQFAADLSLQLGENVAQIYADTTLNGLSGQDIKFQNTDTYRYQEQEVNADTKKITNTGVTREITSGLIIGINGWISGDDMITITVNATVSKRNTDSGTTTNTLPSTSERVVNTQVRTPSGEPIVLSGLIKEDTNTNIEKIPLLGDIPLLGRLFKHQTDTVEKTEIVIYIVPYLSHDDTEENDISLRYERYYNNFVRDMQK